LSIRPLLIFQSNIEAMGEAELSKDIDATSVFAKLAPAHKEHIIRALQSKGHVVGVVGTLGFVPLPLLYWLMLAIMLVGNVILT
jgi:soluble P-type ATPase